MFTVNHVIKYYRRTFLLKTNAIVCVKSEISRLCSEIYTYHAESLKHNNIY